MQMLTESRASEGLVVGRRAECFGCNENAASACSNKAAVPILDIIVSSITDFRADPLLATAAGCSFGDFTVLIESPFHIHGCVAQLLC